MASDLSSGCTETNELFDDEKEEGEISLEDVSSSEEGQPYKYQPRAVGYCQYCLSTPHCATWCRSLTVNKNYIKRDAGLQGKENRNKHCNYPKDIPPCLSSNLVTGSTTISTTKGTTGGSYSSTLQEKNDDDNDLVPISSDSDMELVGLETKPEKKLRRRSSVRKSSKIRKKRRKKSLSPHSLSLSPLSVDLAIKDSIHRVEPTSIVDSKKDNSHKSRHRSPEKKNKTATTKALTPIRRRNHALTTRIRSSPKVKRRPRSPLPRKSSPLPRKSSPLRQRKPPTKKVAPTSVESPGTPFQQQRRGTFSKLLKKVKQLEPFRYKENGISLKDKLSIFINKKEQSSNKERSDQEVHDKENTLVEIVVKEETVSKKNDVVIEKDKEDTLKEQNKIPVPEKQVEDKEDDDDLVILRQIALETKQKKSIMLKPEEIKTEPVEQPPLPPLLPPPPSSPPMTAADLESLDIEPEPETEGEATKLPNFCMDDNEEDLELRMIALRSAVLKKHRTRMQCGKKKKEKTTSPLPRIESPFTSTFLEDFPLLAEICSPSSPLSLKKDIYSTEDMELDSDIEMDKEIAAMSESESPYSPTDDIGNHMQVENANVERKEVNCSLYSPSNPTETPMGIGKNSTFKNNTLEGSILEFTNQESRPYSPTDLTVYDPDLPGVHSNDNSKTVAPLQPPPLPPLSMFQQPMMIGSEPKLLNPFFGSSVQMVPASMTNFTATMPTHAAAASLFAYPTTSPTTSLGMNVPSVTNIGINTPTASNLRLTEQTAMDLSMKSPARTNLGMNAPMATNVSMHASTITGQGVNASVTIETEYQQQLISSITNESLDSFGETDIDGSPLVPIEKGSDHHSSWSFIDEPLYLQGLPDITNKNLNRIPTLMDNDLVPTSVLKTNKQLQKQLPKKIQQPQVQQQQSEGLFRNAKMIPVELQSNKNVSSTFFKPIKLNSSSKKNMTSQPAAAFNVDAEKDLVQDPLRTRLHLETSKAKRKPTPISSQSERRRKRRRRSVFKRSSSMLSSNNVENTKPKSQESSKDEAKRESQSGKRRRSSIEDDEDALREILLASLAKRIKEHHPSITTKLQASEATPIKTPDSNSKVEKPKNSPSPSELNSSAAQPKTTPLIPITQRPTTSPIRPKKLTITTTVATDLPIRKLVRKPSVIPASTKVVNNAKRYQNLLLQRKLQQQKISLLTCSSRFKLNNNNNNSNSTQVQNLGSPKITKKPTEIQRIIINLNEDTESESEVEEAAKLKESPTKAARPILNIPISDFEKSVDQFLKNVRMQQEMAAKANETVSKAMPAPSVPLKKPKPPIAQPITKNIAVSPNTPVSTGTATKTTTVNIAAATTAPKLNKETAVVSTKTAKTDIKLSNLTVTPQAVKHLPASQQEEYRRLKQQIFEREKLKLQKAESISSQSKPANEKIVNTSSSPVSSVSSSPSLTSSTQKTVSKSAAAVVPFTKPQEVSTLNKTVPKTQLVVAISPLSKQNNIDTEKTPIIHTSTKIVHSTPSVSEDSTANKTATINNLVNKNNSMSSSPKSTEIVSRITPQLKNTTASNSNVPNINNQQTVLLNKMNDALNSQKMQISAVAQKVSSLRILTKEQINTKTSQIQQAMSNSEGQVHMDDLNRINKKLHGAQVSESKSVNSENASMPVDKLFSKTEQNVKQSVASTSETSSTINKSTESWEDFRQVVSNEVQSLPNLTAEDQKKLLLEIEEELIKTRHSVLDDITEMSGSLRQWEIERDMQKLLATEVKSLREQLKKAEKRLQQQKEKLNTIQPKVSTYQAKINTGRKECLRLSKKCNGLGQQIVGPNYKVPTAGAELLNNRIKEVATHTQKLRNKKNQSTENVSNLEKTDKTKSKNNLKSNNNSNLKKKVSNEKVNIQNNESVSVNNNSNFIKESIGINKNTELQINNNNTNTKSNVVNIVDNERENQPMEIDNEKLNFTSENNINLINKSPLTKTNVEHFILNSENNFNIEVDKTLTNNTISSTILIAKNNFNIESDKESHKANMPNTIRKTGNITNIQTVEPLLNTVLQSTFLTKQMSVNFEHVTSTSTINESDQETPNESKEENVTVPCGVENSSFNTKHVQNENSLSNIEDENSTSRNFNLNNHLNSNLSEENVPVLKIEPPSIETTVENSSFNEETIIKNEFETPLNETSIAQPNLISEHNIEIKSEKNIPESQQQLIETDIEQTNNTELANASMITEESVTTTTNYENIEIRNLNEVLSVNNEIERLCLKNHESSTSKILKNIEHSNFMENITSSKESNATEVPERDDQCSEPVTEEEHVEQPSEVIDRNRSENRVDKVTKRKVLQPYESILKHFNLPRNNKTDGILCPYQLMGTCSDGDCQFIHQSTSHFQ